MKKAERGTCGVQACVPHSRTLQVLEQAQRPSLGPLTQLRFRRPTVVADTGLGPLPTRALLLQGPQTGTSAFSGGKGLQLT